MTCAQPGFPAAMRCYGRGSCAGSQCVCDGPDDWGGVSDFVLPAFSACQVHRPSLLGMNIAAAVLCGAAALTSEYCLYARYKRHGLHSLQGAFSSCTAATSALMGATSLCRLANTSRRVVGVDPLTTILWALGMLCFWLTNALYLPLWFRRLGKLVSGDKLIWYVDSSALRRMHGVNCVVLPAWFAVQAALIVACAKVALLAESQAEMQVAAMLLACSVVLFCALTLVYFGVIARALLQGIGTQSPRKHQGSAQTNAKRRVIAFFSLLCVSSTFAGVCICVVGFWPAMQVAWFGHVTSVLLCGVASWCLVGMYLEWPRRRSKVSLHESQADTGKSTEVVQLPRLFAKRFVSKRGVSKMPKLSEEQLEPAASGQQQQLDVVGDRRPGDMAGRPGLGLVEAC
jgi:hypothetical protein